MIQMVSSMIGGAIIGAVLYGYWGAAAGAVLGLITWYCTSISLEYEREDEKEEPLGYYPIDEFPGKEGLYLVLIERNSDPVVVRYCTCLVAGEIKFDWFHGYQLMPQPRYWRLLRLEKAHITPPSTITIEIGQ